MDVTLRELIYGEQVRGRHPRRQAAQGGDPRRIVGAGAAARSSSISQASFDALAKAGSMLGSAAIIVMDETTSMVWVAMNLLHFYKHESCGKCTPCREGADWLHRILTKIERGEGQMRDIDLLVSICQQHRRQDAVRVRRRRDRRRC